MFKLKRQEVQIGPLTAIDAAVLLVLILLQGFAFLVFHCIGKIDANVNHFFHRYGKQFFQEYGKEFFLTYGKQNFQG